MLQERPSFFVGELVRVCSARSSVTTFFSNTPPCTDYRCETAACRKLHAWLFGKGHFLFISLCKCTWSWKKVKKLSYVQFVMPSILQMDLAWNHIAPNTALL
jgi:hypothetical protein